MMLHHSVEMIQVRTIQEIRLQKTIHRKIPLIAHLKELLTIHLLRMDLPLVEMALLTILLIRMIRMEILPIIHPTRIQAIVLMVKQIQRTMTRTMTKRRKNRNSRPNHLMTF